MTIDEIGYLPLDKLQSNLLFQVINKPRPGLQAVSVYSTQTPEWRYREFSRS